MGISDHVTCLLRNLYAGQEATVRTRHGTIDWFQIGKGVGQDFILSLCLFNLYAENIMGNAGLDEAQAGIRIAGRNINNLRMQMTTPLWQKAKRNKEPLNEGKRGESKSWIIAQHSENEDHGICPIISWQTDGEIMETVTDFILLGSKITADGDCSHEIKRHLLL